VKGPPREEGREGSSEMAMKAEQDLLAVSLNGGYRAARSHS